MKEKCFNLFLLSFFVVVVENVPQIEEIGRKANKYYNIYVSNRYNNSNNKQTNTTEYSAFNAVHIYKHTEP